MEEGHLITEKS